MADQTPGQMACAAYRSGYALDQYHSAGLRSLHLFAGAGGGILADLLLGHRPICAVELDPYCQQVLMQRQRDGVLPWFPIWDNVRNFDGRPWRGIVDVVSAGFPCQPWSVAGKRAGEHDERNLWPDTYRILCEVRPRYAFFENVPGLLVHPYMRRILSDCARARYDARWTVLGASDVGAPHRRKRLWILAYAQRRGGSRLHERQQSGYVEADAGWSSPDSAGGATAAHHGRRVSRQGAEGSDVADARRLGLEAGRLGSESTTGGSVQHDQSERGGTALSDATRQHVGTPRQSRQPGDMGHADQQGLAVGQGQRGDDGAECPPLERAGGRFPQSGVGGDVPDGVAPGVDGWAWPAEPTDIPRVARNIPDRVARLKALGNGQVSLCAAVAWCLLRARERDDG